MKTVLILVSLLILNSVNLLSVEKIFISKDLKFFNMASTENDELYVCGVTYEDHFLTDSYHTFVIKSTDYGESWDYVLKKDFVFMEQSYQDRYSLLHIFSKGNDSIFVIGEGGIIFKSYDAGVSWDSSRITYKIDGKNHDISDRSLCKDAKNFNFQIWAAYFLDANSDFNPIVYSTDFGNNWTYFERIDEPKENNEDILRTGFLYIPNDSLIYYTHQTFYGKIHLNVYNIKSNENRYINTLPKEKQKYFQFTNDSTCFFYGFYFDEKNEYVYPSAYVTKDRGDSFINYFDENEEVLGEFSDYVTNESFEYLIGMDTFFYREIGTSEWIRLEFESDVIRDVELLNNNMIFAAENDDYILKIDDITSVKESNDIFKNSNQIAKSSLFLNFNAKDNYSYQIYDLRGKEKHSGTILVNSDFLTFDVSYLQDGTYIIVFKDSKGQVSENVIFIKE